MPKSYVKKISSLLIANRGEIAIRIMRAASELGIRTVSVYTFEDRYSLHRYKADEAYQIGLARRCREEGIVFVGPSPEAMNALGDKV
eukprot:gene54408-72709_t